MKASLEAWGADSNLFNQGGAKQSEDPNVVAATMAKPGVMLKRPVGSNRPFQQDAELPRHRSNEGQGRACDLYWMGREEGKHRALSAIPQAQRYSHVSRSMSLG